MWFEPDEVHLQIAEDLYLHKNQELLGCRNETSLRKFISEEIVRRETSERCLADSSFAMSSASLEDPQDSLQNVATEIAATQSESLQAFF